MANVIVMGTLAGARAARTKIDAARGYPKAGTNAATGEASLVGGPGWTVTSLMLTRIVDTGGLIGTAGATYFIVGPISDADKAWIQANVASPPTIVDAPIALLRKGLRFYQRITGWGASAPTTTEDQIDFDEAVIP